MCCHKSRQVLYTWLYSESCGGPYMGFSGTVTKMVLFLQENTIKTPLICVVGLGAPLISLWFHVFSVMHRIFMCICCLQGLDLNILILMRGQKWVQTTGPQPWHFGECKQSFYLQASHAAVTRVKGSPSDFYMMGGVGCVAWRKNISWRWSF